MQFTNTIKQSPYLRSLLLICMILTGVLVFLLVSGGKVQSDALGLREEILRNQKELIQLQEIVMSQQGPSIQNAYSFTPFSEVVPFITELETLLGRVDPDVQISLQGDEVEIERDHEASYVILLSNIRSGSKFKKALNELYESNRLLEVKNLVVNYDEGRIRGAQFIIKLYLI